MLEKLRRTAQNLLASARGIAARVPSALRKLNPLAVFSFAAVLLITPNIASASVASWAIMQLAHALQAIVGFFGELLIALVSVLITVASYNDFVSSKAVTIGWVVVRDVTNMFFVLVLLLVAFGTILGHDKWNYKNKTVNKLIVAAIIVNFSRTIMGLIIDFSQVVMLTFVVGFKEVAGGNFANAFRINKMLAAGNTDIADDPDPATTALKIFSAYLLALFMLIISTTTIIYMTVALVIRIVYLWLLTVLSPMAFFLRAVPGQEGLFSKWWKMFTEQLIFGPLMAFFLWLALAVVAAAPNGDVAGGASSASSSVDPAAGASSGAFASDELQSFIIAVALLMGGIKMAEDLAGDAGKMASKIVGSPTDRAKQIGGALGGAAVYGAGQIKLPTFKKDENGKYQWATASSLAFAGAEKAKGTGLAKAFSKEGREQKSMEQKVKALEATGQKEKAAALKEEMLGKVGKGLPRGKSELTEFLKKEQSEHPGSNKAKAAALKLAEAGALNMSDLKAVSKGDKAFEKSLVAASVKSGKHPDMAIDADTFDGALEQSKTMFGEAAHAGEKNKIIDSAISGAMIGPDGKPRSANSPAMLLSVDEKHFTDMQKDKQQKMVDSLEYIKANVGQYEADPAIQSQIISEINAKIASLAAAGAAAGITIPTGNSATARAAMNAQNLKDNGITVTAAGVENAFKSYDVDTGNIDNPAELADFQALVGSNAKTRKSVLKTLDPNVLMAFGGSNNVTMSVLESMTEKDLTDMLSDPEIPRDKMFALKQVMEAHNKVIGTGPFPAGSFEDKVRSMTDAANDKASPLGAAFNSRSFGTEARQWVTQVGAGVASGAVKTAAVYYGVPAAVSMASWAAVPAMAGSGYVAGAVNAAALGAKTIIGGNAVNLGAATAQEAAKAIEAIGKSLSDLSTKAASDYFSDLGSRVNKSVTNVGRTIKYGGARKGYGSTAFDVLV